LKTRTLLSAVIVCVLTFSHAPAWAKNSGEVLLLLESLERTGENAEAITALLKKFPVAAEGAKPNRTQLKESGFDDKISAALLSLPASKPIIAKATVGSDFSDPDFPVTLTMPSDWRVIRNHPLLAPSLVFTPDKLSLEASDLEYGILAGVLSTSTKNPLSAGTQLFEKYWKLSWKQRLNENIKVISSHLQMLGDVPAVVYTVDLIRTQPKRTRKGIMVVTAADEIPLVFAAVLPGNDKREQIIGIMNSIRLVIAPRGWKSITATGKYSLWIPPTWKTTAKGELLMLAASDDPLGTRILLKPAALTSSQDTTAQALSQWIATIGRDGYLKVSGGPMPLVDPRKVTGHTAVLEGKNPVSEREEKYFVGVIQHGEKMLYLTAAAWNRDQFDPLHKTVMQVIATIRF